MNLLGIYDRYVATIDFALQSLAFIRIFECPGFVMTHVLLNALEGLKNT